MHTKEKKSASAYLGHHANEGFITLNNPFSMKMHA